MRQRNVFSLDDVAYAIIETNGKLSVIKKPDKGNPDGRMMGVALPNTGIETVVIRRRYPFRICHEAMQ